MIEKRQLLCTFSNTKSYKIIIEEIKKFYEIYNGRFFVFSNENSPEEVYVTYNIINVDKKITKFPNTISIHRKKQTNTLYSLNSLNKIIEDENGGVLDKTFSVNWSLYSNSFIILNNNMIKIIPIKLLEIINN
jgi:hypothetical protein